jgi:hypothetical protein
MGGVFNLVNMQMYHYAGNNPLKYTDPDGRIVITIGISGAASLLGGVQGSTGIAIGFSWKEGFSIGLYASGGTKVSSVPEPSANAGVTIGVTPKTETVKDIEGSSFGGGVGINAYKGISLDRTTDDRGNGTYSLSANVRGEPLPVPIEFHGTQSETVVVGDTLSNIKENIENKMLEKSFEIKKGIDNFVYEKIIFPITRTEF